MKEGKIKEIISYLLPLHIETAKSSYNPTLEVTLSSGRYLLNSEKTNYSFGSLHTIFKNVFKELDVENLNISNCLLLGLGGGSVINLLRRKHSLLMPITAVEIDPAVIELGKKYFCLEEYENTTIINADAFEFVKNTNSVYDLIIIDLYINDKVPPIFHTREFISRLKSVSHGNSIILFNKMLNTAKSKSEYRKLVYEMTNAFGPLNFLVYRINGTDNRIVCVNTGRIKSAGKTPQNTQVISPDPLFEYN